MAQGQKYTSEIGSAIWPHLNEPDTRFNTDGEYNTKLTLPAETKLVKMVQDMLKAEFKKPLPNRPWQLPYEVDDNGDFVFKFKSSYAPYFFDSRGKMLQAEDVPLLRSGCKLRIGGKMNAYEVSGRQGVSIKLSRIQIVEVGDVESGFDDLGDGYVAEAAPQTPQPDFDEDDADFLRLQEQALGRR